jgi:hypothetical protein
MRRATEMLPVALAAVWLAAWASSPAAAADPPANRVVAMYFHRTVRCPTCMKMGSYSEEAVKSGFAYLVRQGTVAFYDVDFQDPRNALIVQGYGVNGPALILAKVSGDRVVGYKNLIGIWEKVGDKAAFQKYVQENVNDLLR